MSLRDLAVDDFAGSAHRPVVTATGEAGTIYLCHPFLVHAAQAHHGTRPRFLAQAPLLPVDPENRPGEELNAVELATARALADRYMVRLQLEMSSPISAWSVCSWKQPRRFRHGPFSAGNELADFGMVRLQSETHLADFGMVRFQLEMSSPISTWSVCNRERSSPISARYVSNRKRALPKSASSFPGENGPRPNRRGCFQLKMSHVPICEPIARAKGALSRSARICPPRDGPCPDRRSDVHGGPWRSRRKLDSKGDLDMPSSARLTILEAPSILGLRPTGVDTLAEALIEAGLLARRPGRHAGRVAPRAAYDFERDPVSLPSTRRSPISTGPTDRSTAPGFTWTPTCWTTRSCRRWTTGFPADSQPTS